MPTISYFQQLRFDGGRRHGISVDGETIFHEFQAGTDDHDPVLVWYVDIVCEGEHLPYEADAVRQWLLGNTDPMTAALRRIAEEVRAGFDREGYAPFERRIPGVAPDGDITLYMSAVRRVDAYQAADVLSEVADHWVPTIQRLTPLTAIAES